MADERDDKKPPRKRNRNAEARRAWDAANPEKRAAYRAKYRANNKDRIKEMARAWGANNRAKQREEKLKRQRAAERAERVRDYQRRYREANHDKLAEQGLTRQRAWVAKQLETDPDGYRAKRNAHAKLYRQRHKEQLRQRDMDKRVENRYAKADYLADYRDQNREQLREKRRADYARDPEKYLAYNREWKRRERRRLKAGLPPRRLHPVRPAERKANNADADAFFTRPRTPDELDALRREEPAHKELVAADERRMGRMRSADGFRILAPHILRRAERDEQRRIAAMVRRHDQQLAEAAENARLDAIARAVNAQLRRPPDPRPGHHNDPAAPHTLPGTGPGGGLSR